MAGVEQHKKRMANIEALRLVAMMMVVSLHYLWKGGLLEALTGPLSVKGRVAWLLESFSIVAVDVYVLISGFFLVKAKFRAGRVLSLVLQVLFYSCLIPVVLIRMGMLSFEELELYDFWNCIFPIQMEQYWFLSSYVLLVLFAPILNAGIYALKREQLKAAIALLLFVESFMKTVIPARLALSGNGYNALWFMTVYLIAAYIRLYGIPFFEKKNRALACYIISCLGIYALLMFLRKLYFATGKFEDAMSIPMDYNHLLTLTAAVALFYAFRNWEFGRRESVLSGVVCRIAPYSLGVYLLHEQRNVRYVWPSWLWEQNFTSVGLVLWNWAAAILVVMACGLTVDYVRSLIFRGVWKLFAGGKFNLALRKFDERINGRMPDERING